MLEITTASRSLFDESTDRFIEFEGGETVVLEHSLRSISKWESKWCVPFIKNDEKTGDQALDYIRCMVVSGKFPEPLEYSLTNEQLNQISDYISEKMSATVITNQASSRNQEVITSELIYYWMTVLNIPFECENWHFNRLMMLIQVANAKNNPKKMSRKDALSRQRELNEQRRKQYNTAG